MPIHLRQQPFQEDNFETFLENGFNSYWTVVSILQMFKNMHNSRGFDHARKLFIFEIC